MKRNLMVYVLMFLVFTVGCVENCLAQRIKKKTFKVNGVSFNMIYVEGGSFTKPMGHGKGDTTITVESFYIGETEVTCGLYNAVFGLPPITPKQPKPIVKKMNYQKMIFLGSLQLIIK